MGTVSESKVFLWKFLCVLKLTFCSGGGVRRAGGLLGGLRSRRRAAEAERQSGRAAMATEQFQDQYTELPDSSIGGVYICSNLPSRILKIRAFYAGFLLLKRQ